MTTSIKIRVKRLELLPSYASALAAGADLKAAFTQPETLHPGKSILVPTGLYMEIPEGFEVQIRPRSGLALKKQITVLNTPGTIDADYRGEIQVILINHGNHPFVIEPCMRIAQMVLAPVCQADFVVQETLCTTTRGEGGLGHTGSY